MRLKIRSTRIHSRWLCHSNFDFHWKWMMKFRMFPFFPSLHLTTLFGCCDIVTSIFYISFTSTHHFILDSPWNSIHFIWYYWFLADFLSSIFPIFFAMILIYLCNCWLLFHERVQHPSTNYFQCYFNVFVALWYGWLVPRAVTPYFCHPHFTY